MLSVPNGTTPSTLELCGVVFERALSLLRLMILRVSLKSVGMIFRAVVIALCWRF